MSDREKREKLKEISTRTRHNLIISASVPVLTANQLELDYQQYIQTFKDLSEQTESDLYEISNYLGYLMGSYLGGRYSKETTCAEQEKERREIKEEKRPELLSEQEKNSKLVDLCQQAIAFLKSTSYFKSGSYNRELDSFVNGTIYTLLGRLSYCYASLSKFEEAMATYRERVKLQLSRDFSNSGYYVDVFQTIIENDAEFDSRLLSQTERILYSAYFYVLNEGGYPFPTVVERLQKLQEARKALVGASRVLLDEFKLFVEFMLNNARKMLNFELEGALDSDNPSNMRASFAALIEGIKPKAAGSKSVSFADQLANAETELASGSRVPENYDNTVTGFEETPLVFNGLDGVATASDSTVANSNNNVFDPNAPIAGRSSRHMQ